MLSLSLSLNHRPNGNDIIQYKTELTILHNILQIFIALFPPFDFHVFVWF